jgi:hypothetical protein
LVVVSATGALDKTKLLLPEMQCDRARSKSGSKVMSQQSGNRDAALFARGALVVYLSDWVAASRCASRLQ